MNCEKCKKLKEKEDHFKVELEKVRALLNLITQFIKDGVAGMSPEFRGVCPICLSKPVADNKDGVCEYCYNG